MRTPQRPGTTPNFNKTKRRDSIQEIHENDNSQNALDTEDGIIAVNEIFHRFCGDHDQYMEKEAFARYIATVDHEIDAYDANLWESVVDNFDTVLIPGTQVKALSREGFVTMFRLMFEDDPKTAWASLSKLGYNHLLQRKITLAVFGIDGAGKSSIIPACSGARVDFVTPTWGFAKCAVSAIKHTVDVFDLGGGERIRGYWTNYLAECHGAIFVMDGTDVQRLPEVMEALKSVVQDDRFMGKPLLLLVNKQDLPGALSCSEIQAQSTWDPSLLEKTPHLWSECEAAMFPDDSEEDIETNGDKRIRSAFLQLLDLIDGMFQSINRRVSKDTAAQRLREIQEQEERAARVAARKEAAAEEAIQAAQDEADSLKKRLRMLELRNRLLEQIVPTALLEDLDSRSQLETNWFAESDDVVIARLCEQFKTGALH